MLPINVCSQGFAILMWWTAPAAKPGRDELQTCRALGLSNFNE
jgi:hypothetical protein